MGLSELLRRVAETLERLGLPYFITGSMAAIYFGDPRLTNDIDIVTALPLAKVDELCTAFTAPEFNVSEESARAAVTRRGQFNVIHPSSGLKADLIVVADTPFNRSRFSRASALPVVEGFSALLSTPEDVILMKLAAHQEGGSEKHLRDIAGILRVSAARIDRAYISLWAAELGLDEEWTRVAGRVGGSSSGSALP